LIPTLPLHARNRLAELILAAISDGNARAELAALAKTSSPPPWLAAEDLRHASALRARARAATHALEHEPLASPDLALAGALRMAAVLFDSGLHFEVHELLEPHWVSAQGAARDALQGLIQIAVGYQHFANGNDRGARALLAEGAERLGTAGAERLGPAGAEGLGPSALGGFDLVGFAAGVRVSLANGTFSAPPFPRGARAA
jgi:hypothetical protein